MATGPEYFLQAGQALEASEGHREIWNDSSDLNDWRAAMWEQGHAHGKALLALAAAVALSGPGGMLTADEEAWREAASAYRPDGA